METLAKTVIASVAWQSRSCSGDHCFRFGIAASLSLLAMTTLFKGFRRESVGVREAALTVGPWWVKMGAQ